MLKNLSISAKTGLGFALALLVMAAMVIFAVRGLQIASERFTTYRRLARSSVLSGRVQANMLIASRAARDFLKSRDDEQLRIYDERFESAREFALKQQTTMEDPGRRQLSESLVAQLERYQLTNQRVFQLMRSRDKILQETLNPQGARMRQSLSEIMDSANTDEDSEAAYLAGQTLEKVLLGRLYLFKFLDENQSVDVERVRVELGGGFEDDFEKMVAAIDNPRRKDLLQTFSEARESYLAGFEEMVRTIDQRNALISEEVQPLDQSIADVSEQIKLSLKSDQDQLGPSVQSSNSATIRAVVIGSLVAVGLAVLIASLFVRTIKKEMKERWETEQQLAGALDDVKRTNFLSDIALDLTGCGYWHVDYSEPDFYYQSERAARILGEPLKEDGRYHLQDDWFERLEKANPETAELTAERYEGAI